MISAFDSTVTLFNRIGEDESGNGIYEKTIIDRVRAVMYDRTANGGDTAPKSTAKVYFSQSKSRPRDKKTYVSPSEWEGCDKTRFFTFSSAGDCIVIGEYPESVPPENSMLITEASFFDARLKRLRHVKVTCAF